MKGWKRSLFWEGIPLIMFLGVFGLIAIFNWGYEGKLLMPDLGAGDWNSVHLGQILLAMAGGQIALASVILLVVRLIWPGVISGPWLLVPLTLVAIFLIFPSLFIVILCPAAITMVEQTRTAPR